MRVVAAVPAGGLLAGCAAGLYWPDLPFALLLSILIASGLTAAYAFRTARTWLLTLAVSAGFAVGATLLAADAWCAAWRPSLRVAFESIARAERQDAARARRPLSEEETAAVVLVGVLRQDAAPSAAGVSLDLAATWIERSGARRGAKTTVWGPPSGAPRPAEAGRHNCETGSRPVRFDPTANPVEGGVILTVTGSLATGRLPEWRRGRTVRAQAFLRRASRYLNAEVPDQERALARRGTTLVGSVKSGALVEVLAPGSLVAEAAASVRANARRAIHTAVGHWSARSAGIVTAIAIGDRTGLGADVQRRLQEAGTYHVIAISGGNIAILAALTLAFFRVAGVLGRGAMVTAIAGLVAYGYVVGGGASVERATLMGVVYFAGRALDLRGPPLNALALVAGILVVADPLAVADPAFLLTFGATTAILVVMPAVPVSQMPAVVAPMAAMFAASAGAEAALMPIAAGLFSRVTFAGLVLNFAAIPLMAVAQVAGMAVVVLSVVSPPLALIAGWIAHVGAEGLVRSASLVAWVPAVTWRVAPPGAVSVVIYYAGLITAWTLWRVRPSLFNSLAPVPLRLVHRTAALAALAAAFWILAEPWTLVAARGDGRLHVTFVDVGQGDAVFVRFPRGATLVVDAGGLGGSSPFDIGDRVVAPVLRRAGVRRLGTMVLSHGDADHIGGAPSLLREFRPWDVWEGVPVPRFEPLRALRSESSRRGARWFAVQTNDSVSVDEVTVAVRHPDPADWERQDVRNDDSVVLELLWHDVSIVLTGDIGRDVERTIASRFGESPLRVVKIPHHGSLSSSAAEFVRALAPRAAVVSVGRSNTFGHPASAVLERYQDVGAEIFRTDRDGAVMVETDGRSLDVRTFTGRHVHITSSPALHQRTSPRKHESTKTHVENTVAPSR